MRVDCSSCGLQQPNRNRGHAEPEQQTLPGSAVSGVNTSLKSEEHSSEVKKDVTVIDSKYTGPSVNRLGGVWGSQLSSAVSFSPKPYTG